MRSQLTRAVFRQMIHNELQCGTACRPRPEAHLCLRTRCAQPIPTIPKRSLFGFSGKSKRRPKPVNYAAGHETMLELSDRLKKGERPPPPEELVEAFVKFFIAKQAAYRSSPLDDIQARDALTTLEYLRGVDTGERTIGHLASDKLRVALNVLRSPVSHDKSQAHNKLARNLFAILKGRWEDDGQAQSQEEQARDILSYITIMSESGDALYAREIAELYWDASLKHSELSIWPRILRGLMMENKAEELDKTVEIMRKCGVPFGDKHLGTILRHCAGPSQDLDLIKKWYHHPLANGETLSLQTQSSVLKLCIARNELEFGDTVFKSLLETRSGEEGDKANKATWDTMFQWSAAKGKSVDEIERMMHVMIRRSEDEKTGLRPDMDTINGLIELANARHDSYTAERYVALGQKWGLQPDMRTFLLQLDYRIKEGDLGGARTAYAHLQGEEVPDDEDLPLVNKLIVALSHDGPRQHDAIMGLAEDLSERKGRFESDTVAALCSIHLQRGENDDLVDLLNTHAFHYGLKQRAGISKVLLDHCLDPETSTFQAWETYNLLRQTFPEIDTPTRTAMMNNFFNRDRSDMATHVFGHMRQQQIKALRPTIPIYAQCLSGLGRAGDRKSLHIVHNMIKLDSEIEPDTQLYNALMLGFSGCDEFIMVLRFWDEILHSREGPSYASIQIALRACESIDNGSEELARDIWSKLHKLEIEVTREIYAAYVGALASHKLFDECVGLIDDAERKVGYKPDALLLGTFYNATRSSDARARIKEWAWKAYPAAYEDLLKYGTITTFATYRDSESGEEKQVQKDSYIDIGSIGRDVEP